MRPSTLALIDLRGEMLCARPYLGRRAS